MTGLLPIRLLHAYRSDESLRRQGHKYEIEVRIVLDGGGCYIALTLPSA